jgi:lysozyme family protein
VTNIVATLKQLNAERWSHCAVLLKRQAEVNSVAIRLCAAKSRYQVISQEVWGTPDRWWFVAIVHERESSQDFTTQLSQGDPLNRVSRHVPRGRGPFEEHDGHDAFFWGAVDALMKCPPFAGKWTDWSIGGALTLFVLYNGPGYEEYHHEASPYDWGATTIEQWGKYIADGRWSPNAWDTQIGCAALLKGMMALDPTIKVPT